jgi:hypothetical protein
MDSIKPLNPFWNMYRLKLRAAIERNPEEYGSTLERAERDADFMARKFAAKCEGNPDAIKGITIHTSSAFKATAKALGIGCSYGQFSGPSSEVS